MSIATHTPPGLVEMLAALVAAPSISSARPELDQGNRRVIDLLAGWLADLGFACEVMPIPDRPDKANLIATLGRGAGGLVLAGHTDTVPFDAGRWRHDPFTLTVANGRLYGLGTADMKGFFPLVIEAARGLDAGALTAPLIVLATADEETSMAGAKALVAAGRPAARHAVIGEPTSLRPVNVHKGIMMEAIHLTGRSGHSSDPAQGANALDAMYRVMGALMEWRAALARRHRDERFAVPVPTLNLGHIHGGDNPNRICPDCTLHMDLRPLPGMAIEGLRAELQERVTHALRDSGVTARFEVLFDGVPPLETPATAPIVRAAEELTGVPAGAVTFGTEGPFLAAMGMDTVILGPGNLAQAHQPDEYLALDRIAPAIELLRGLAHRFCTA